MGIPETVAVVSGVAALFSALYARYAWSSTRQALIHQVLMDIHADYRSPEMLDAVKSLWDLHRAHGRAHIAAEYERLRVADDAILLALPAKDRLDFIRTTLHHKRRLVAHFYLHLADLYVNKILPKEVLYSGWCRGDLAIIPEVLLPIEETLGVAYGTGTPKRHMAKLYDDAPTIQPAPPRA